jgi:hypothetical protein
MGDATRFYPGPECLHLSLVDEARRHHTDYIRSLAAKNDARIEQRTRSIGEGGALARARKRRFVAWLRTVGDISHSVALRQAHEALSPEHAAERAAADGFHWPFVATGWGMELRRDAVRPEWAALAFDLVRSPEWAALPFNASGAP